MLKNTEKKKEVLYIYFLWTWRLRFYKVNYFYFFIKDILKRNWLFRLFRQLECGEEEYSDP